MKVLPGVAVGRDRRVSAVVLAALAGFVVATYSVVVVGGGALVGELERPNVYLSILATVIVAVYSQPVGDRTRVWAERVLYGAQGSPYEVLSRSAASMSGGRSGEDVPTSIARALAEGTGADWTQVWLCRDERWELAASWPPDATGVSRDAPERQPPAGRREQSVVLGGERLGVLRVQERPRHPLTSVEERLFAGLASQAGPALYGVRLRRELSARLEQLSERAGELRESRQRLIDAHDHARQQLERNIHDGAQQHLVALTVNLRLAATVAASSPERATGVLADQADAADAAIGTLLDLSRGIYPPTLISDGIGAALRSVVHASPIPVHVDDRLQGIRAGADVEGAVYFCCLEAVQNAVKHSGGSAVTVQLARDAGDLVFDVRDDGSGLAASAVAAATGGGLQNMRDRVDAIGGTLAIRAGVDGRVGTVVAGRIPVPAPDDARPIR